jgi:serine/threonine protein kinase
MGELRTLAPGSIVGSFVVDRFLAKGGMGVVYRARHRRLNRDVALKVLDVPVTVGLEGAARFRREALAMAQLEHPNIVAVYDAGEVDGVYYIAMQFVSGGTLQTVIERMGRRGVFLPLPHVLEIMRQVCSALEYAHGRGLVHRDIKPSNILCQSEHRFLLADFGIVLDLRNGDRTAYGKLSAGTVTYMSPEQARGERLDARSDIYSLGVLLYCLLTNRPPFDDPNPLTVMYQHVNELPPLIDKVRQDVPAELLRILKRCMAKKPEERFATAKEMLSALANVNLTVASSPRRAWLPIALVVFAIVLAVGIVALVVSERIQTDDASLSPTSAAKDFHPPASTMVRSILREIPVVSTVTAENLPTARLSASTPTIAPTRRPTVRSASRPMLSPISDEPPTTTPWALIDSDATESTEMQPTSLPVDAP